MKTSLLSIGFFIETKLSSIDVNYHLVSVEPPDNAAEIFNVVKRG